MVTLKRSLVNFWRVGPRYWLRQQLTIDTEKSGRLVGRDEFGNRYFENLNPLEELPGRSRWVDLNQHNYHISQIPPEWHSWLHRIRQLPPTEDPIMLASSPAWKVQHRENLTGTRGAYRPYSTVGPKIHDWQPKVAARNGGGSETVDGA